MTIVVTIPGLSRTFRASASGTGPGLLPDRRPPRSVR
jgi:hypothetical protein